MWACPRRYLTLKGMVMSLILKKPLRRSPRIITRARTQETNFAITDLSETAAETNDSSFMVAIIGNREGTLPCPPNMCRTPVVYPATKSKLSGLIGIYLWGLQ